jgi:succinoglycan biosynthesis protein ExoM
MAQMNSVTVCICTYKRDSLFPTLVSIEQQQLNGDIELDVVVVDNDGEGSALRIVEQIRSRGNIKISYGIEPVQNISLARNKAVSLATGDWLAFIDDDEIAECQWIETLLKSVSKYKAGIAIGSVIPKFPMGAPKWILTGGFFDRPMMEEGTIIDSGGTGNALVRRDMVSDLGVPFDIRFGLSGGEDLDFFVRLRKQGAVMISCPNAQVEEEVECTRLNASYLSQRALRGGETYIKVHIHDCSFIRRIYELIKALIGLILYGAFGILFLPLGRAVFFPKILKAVSQYGKIRTLLGMSGLEMYRT